MESGNGDFSGRGDDLSSAPRVSISSCQGSHVFAPVLSNTTVRGDINIFSCSGGDSSSPAITPKPDTDIKSVILAYKKSILPVYRAVQEYNSLPGQYVQLEDRYTKLLMVEKHRPQKEREEEISARGDTLHQVLMTRDSTAYQSISMERLFSPLNNGDVPRAVLLQGHSGMGKSFTAQKIMHDWVLGAVFADIFDAIFHLRCKELNLCTQEKSLVELLNLESSFHPAMEEVFIKSPQKVLFLVDGFDELRFSLDNPSLSPPNDPYTKAPVEATLRALLQGNILSESSLLVTSRSTASDRLSKLLKHPHRFTEILGFSEGGVEEYFQRFFKDKELYSQEAFDSVRSNESLFTACFIPIICWIICTVLREHFEEGKKDQRALTTTTSVFVHFVSTVLEHHCQGLSQPIPSLLRSLGQLAERGLLEQQILFEEKQVQETVLDPVNVPFLCKFLLKKKVGKKTMFSFMHLSFQEFFTALFYATTDVEEGRRKIENLLQKDQDQDSDHHLIPVIQFLFGFSNNELRETLAETLGISICPTIHAQLEEWFLRLNSNLSEIHKNECEFIFNPERSIDIFNYLYERHEEEFMRRAMEAWESYRPTDTALSKTDCWVLCYCFQYCPEIRCVHLTDCNITAEKLRMLKPVLNRCNTLWLHVEDLSDNDVEDLITCLGRGKTIGLLHLGRSTNPLEGDPPAIARLVKSKLTDQGVRRILDSLCMQKSLGSLELEAFSVTLTTVKILFDLLQKKAFEICVNFGAALLTDSEDADLRIFLLKIRKNLYPEFSDNVIECLQVSAEFVLAVQDAERQVPQKRLTGFLLRLSPDSEIATINWRTFLRCCLAHNQEIEEHADSLMSCLSSMPGLEEVSVDVSCLNESWATGFLQLTLACPRLKTITCSMRMRDKRYSADVCVESKKEMLRLSVRNCFWYNLYVLPDGPQCRAHLDLTCLILILPLSPELQHLDWRTFFSSCLSLEGITDHPDRDEQVEALLSFLHSVPGLIGLRLDVGSLTQRWASGLVSLAQACPTLTTLRLYCGEQGFGTLSEEGLNILQQSQHHLKGILSLTGLKCRVPAEQCLDHTEKKHYEQRVVLELTGDSLQERDVWTAEELLNCDDPFKLHP